MAPLSLAGKHCAIVGATGVIGSSIARAFADRGAVLTLLSRKVLEAQPQFESELRPFTPPVDQTAPSSSSSPPQSGRPTAHRFIPLDVSRPGDISNVFKHEAKGNVPEVVGPVDILINCAGISQTTLIKRSSDKELADVLNTNLLATMLACKHARLERKGTALTDQHCTRTSLTTGFKAV